MGYRYIGSKIKLVDFILSKINKIIGTKGHVCDLMSGTGSMSLELRKRGYNVTAVDVMTYSFHHTNVCLKIFSPPKFNKLIKSIELLIDADSSLFPVTEYETILKYLNGLKPIRGYFWKEFSPEGDPSNGSQPRKYFTSHNATKIDAIREKIKNWRENKLLSGLEHSLLLHDLIMATNDIANIAGTYGHYLSSFVKRAEDDIRLIPSVFNAEGKLQGHKVIREYAENVAKKISCDLCYIDPPYMKRQYAANYHILETLAREDSPEAIGTSGLRPWRDQYSNFCTKTKIRDAFDKIFVEMDCPHFLISYSEDGLLKIDELMKFFNNYGQVKLDKKLYKRFRSNNSKLSQTISEYLIHIARN